MNEMKRKIRRIEERYRNHVSQIEARREECLKERDREMSKQKKKREGIAKRMMDLGLE